VCLIVNPRAGGGRAARLLPRVEASLRGDALRVRVERTRSLELARELARDAASRGEVAAAMGGDGLLGAVAGVLRDGAGTLGVVPGGRGNDFARKLGVGTDVAVACRVLAHGRERMVDVAEAVGASDGAPRRGEPASDGAPAGAGRTILGIASAGLDSDVQDIANATRLPLGRLVYAYATLRALAVWRPAAWHVTVDGTAHDFRGYSVAVANSGVFGGGMRLVPQAALDDGLLDVVLTRERSRAGLLVNLPRVFRGTHVGDPALVFLRGREIAFAADRPFVAYADGEPVASLPVTVRVAHRALRVLVP
jgi:YegS/Rv2252/BmrU family lipid kinase